MKNFLAGIGLGVGIGLMLAPEKGSLTRKKIMERLGAATDDLRESSEPIMSAVSGQVEKLVGAEEQSIQHNSIREGEEEGTRVLEILNSASKTKLMSVSGIGDATARRIIEARPYNSAEQVVEDGVLSEAIMGTLKKTLLLDDEAA
jgi:DNA uptake protein ComE-like DNA-binding protein